MSKTLQEILSVKSERYQQLEAAAHAAGLSLPDYLDREWEKANPPLPKEQLIERMKTRTRVKVDAAAAIREAREERDAQMDEWIKNVRR